MEIKSCFTKNAKNSENFVVTSSKSNCLSNLIERLSCLGFWFYMFVLVYGMRVSPLEHQDGSYFSRKYHYVRWGMEFCREKLVILRCFLTHMGLKTPFLVFKI